MAIIGVNYSGLNETFHYHHVYLYTRDKNIIFNCGDIICDWYYAKKYYLTNCVDNEGFSHSSSVDSIFFDGVKLNFSYFHYENDEPILKYPNKTKEYWYDDPIIDGWEMFVPEDEEWTWEQLKEYCKGKVSFLEISDSMSDNLSQERITDFNSK